MFSVGKLDGCIRAVDISCRKGNRNRADSSSGLVDEFCVVETADSVFGLGGDVFMFAKFHNMAVKFHIIKGSVIAEGNNGAFALFANKFFTGNTGEISCAGCFNNDRNVGINGESGVSGAGRKADVSLLYCECNESMRAYGVPRHRHLSEIEQELSAAAGEKVTITFTPHLMPVNTGILTTTVAKLKPGTTIEQMRCERVSQNVWALASANAVSL